MCVQAPRERSNLDDRMKANLEEHTQTQDGLIEREIQGCR